MASHGDLFPETDAGSQRRMPVYLLLDTSGSMSGDPIVAVNQGVNLLYNELMDQAEAYELVWISVITFDSSARQLMPLTEIGKFTPPSLSAGGGTAMGEAFKVLSNALETEIKARSADVKGDYKPLVFLLTDGEPTDDYKEGLRILKSRISRKPANIIALGCGNHVNESTLKEITESAFKLSALSSDGIKEFFKWVSQSVRTASKSVGGSGGGDVKVALPPPPPGFEVVL